MICLLIAICGVKYEGLRVCDCMSDPFQRPNEPQNHRPGNLTAPAEHKPPESLTSGPLLSVHSTPITGPSFCGSPCGFGPFISYILRVCGQLFLTLTFFCSLRYHCFTESSQENITKPVRSGRPLALNSFSLLCQTKHLHSSLHLPVVSVLTHWS